MSETKSGSSGDFCADFCTGLNAGDPDEVDEGDSENSVAIESIDPLVFVISAGPKQLSTTGR